MRQAWSYPRCRSSSFSRPQCVPSELQQFPLGYIQRKFPNDYSEQANLEIESQLGRGWVLTMGYQYVHALDLPVYLSVNGVPSGRLPDGRQSFATADPRFGFALIATPSGFSDYNGGIVSLRRSFANHYSVLANYTYSKSIDIATDVQLTDTPQDPGRTGTPVLHSPVPYGR